MGIGPRGIENEDRNIVANFATASPQHDTGKGMQTFANGLASGVSAGGRDSFPMSKDNIPYNTLVSLARTQQKGDINMVSNIDRGGENIGQETRKG